MFWHVLVLSHNHCTGSCRNARVVGMVVVIHSTVLVAAPVSSYGYLGTVVLLDRDCQIG